MTQQATIENTHRVTVGGEQAFCHAGNYREVCDALLAKHPGCTVDVEPIDGARSMINTAPLSAPQSIFPRGPRLDLSVGGKARSDEGRLAMLDAGFSPAMPIYAAGTRVNETGVENASKSRLEWEKLPPAAEVCQRLMVQVAGEQRRDVVVDRVFNLRMTADGRITRGNASFPITESAFGSLLSRTNIGGHAYLRKCPTALRAVNVNHWMQSGAERDNASALAAIACKQDFTPTDAKLRTRLNDEQREVFAVTGGSYGAFDVDKIAQAIALAIPGGARGSVFYDGQRARFEVLFHSDIEPAEYVAGEFFKAGVLVSTDDTGGGSIRVSAVVWQNLCLNLIILDECVQQFAAIRHVGEVETLAARFREAFAEALESIDHFVAKWDEACREDVLTATLDAQEFDIPSGGLNITDVLPGLFNGIIERELVPVRGERRQVVKDLVRMYDEDESAARFTPVGPDSVRAKDYVSRAAIVNAFTRYAHKVNGDAFARADIERAAGGLLRAEGKRKTLPFEPLRDESKKI